MKRGQRVVFVRGLGVAVVVACACIRFFVGLTEFIRKRGEGIVCALCLSLRRIIGGVCVFECGERVLGRFVCCRWLALISIERRHKVRQVPVACVLGGRAVGCLSKRGHHIRQLCVVSIGFGGGFGIVLVKRGHHVGQIAVRFRGRVRGVVRVVKGRHHIAEIGVRLGRGGGVIIVTAERGHHVAEIGIGFRGLGRIALAVIAEGGQHIRQITTGVRRRCVTVVVRRIKGGHHGRQVIAGGGFGLGFRFGQHRGDAVEIDHRNDRFGFGLGFGRGGFFDHLFFDRLGGGLLFLGRLFGGLVQRLKLFIEQFQTRGQQHTTRRWFALGRERGPHAGAQFQRVMLAQTFQHIGHTCAQRFGIGRFAFGGRRLFAGHGVLLWSMPSNLALSLQITVQIAGTGT